MTTSPDRRSPRIADISVQDLFGRYTYRLPVKGTLDPELWVLYGGNGTGKTTILKLLHHLLSGGAGRGHKTAVTRVPFRSVAIRFDNGVVVEATRPECSDGSYGMTLSAAGERHHVLYEVDEDGRISKIGPHAEAQELFARRVGDELGLMPYFLGDDRRLDSDAFEEETGRSRTEERLYRSYSELALMERRELLPDTPSVQLGIAFERVQQWARREALSGANVGNENANTIYANVLQQLTFESDEQLNEDFGPTETSDVVTTLHEIAERTKEQSKFGITLPFEAKKIVDLITGARAERRILMVRVLRPYLDGLKARLDAQDSLYRTLDVYTNVINAFLFDKEIGIDVRRGIVVKTTSGIQLEPERLSSGERQLLSLLSSLILARQQRFSLVLIDEPELSLNVAWQRELVPALLACAEGGEIQFCLATHSVELLSHYRDRVVTLRPKVRAGK